MKHQRTWSAAAGVRGSLRILSSDTVWRVWVVLLALLAWYIITAFELVAPLALPSPQRVWSRFLEIFQNGYLDTSLGTHISVSITRLLLAYAAVCITGIPLGLAMGYSRKVKAVFDPVIEFYRPVPPLAYLMVLIAWFGIGELPKLALIYIVGLPIVTVSSAAAVKGVRVERINGALSLGANQWQVFRMVIFPSCFPEILTGMRVTFGLSFSVLVAAEMMAASSGLGWMVRHAGQFLRTDVVLVGVFVMAIAALIGEGLLRLAERKLLPWAGRN